MEEEKIHPVQKLMDNIWLLLILGILIPFLSYTLWGVIELLSLSEALLP
ncbi:MAG: hypothetical protein WD035_02580 [Balneolaceae bacterium]